jgi:lipopolysaccharide export system protein LptA
MFQTFTRSLLVAALLAALPGLVHAERADRDKPVNIESDRMTVDDQNKVNIFEGKVVLTQGTLVLRSNKLVVTQDASGFQRGIATGGPNGLAHFRQKREGSDEYTDGEGDRIEHDNKLEQTELFGHAWVRSGKDDVRGEYIFVDGKTGNYSATSGPNGTSAAATGGRVRAIIQPKGKPATNTASPAPSLKPAVELPPAKQ